MPIRIPPSFPGNRRNKRVSQSERFASVSGTRIGSPRSPSSLSFPSFLSSVSRVSDSDGVGRAVRETCEEQETPLTKRKTIGLSKTIVKSSCIKKKAKKHLRKLNPAEIVQEINFTGENFSCAHAKISPPVPRRSWISVTQLVSCHRRGRREGARRIISLHVSL